MVPRRNWYLLIDLEGFKGLVDLSTCEWITCVSFLRADQVTLPVTEPVDYRCRSWNAYLSVSASHFDKPVLSCVVPLILITDKIVQLIIPTFTLDFSWSFSLVQVALHLFMVSLLLLGTFSYFIRIYPHYQYALWLLLALLLCTISPGSLHYHAQGCPCSQISQISEEVHASWIELGLWELFHCVNSRASWKA